jgi:hypothetical protein
MTFFLQEANDNDYMVLLIIITPSPALKSWLLVLE